MAALLECPCCERVFSLEKIASRRFSCERCQEDVEPLFFPAFTATPTPRSEAAPVLSQTSTCFYHPQKIAQSICESCGVFVCGLCETTAGEKIYCVKCLEKGVAKEKGERFIQKAVLYDGIALGLALAPLTLFLAILSPLTSLASILLFLFYRKKSKSIIPRTPWRWICAAILSLLQIFFILWLFLS